MSIEPPEEGNGSVSQQPDGFQIQIYSLYLFFFAILFPTASEVLGLILYNQLSQTFQENYLLANFISVFGHLQCLLNLNLLKPVFLIFSESRISETNEINKFLDYIQNDYFCFFFIFAFIKFTSSNWYFKRSKKKKISSHLVLFPAIKHIRSMCHLVLKWILRSRASSLITGLTTSSLWQPTKNMYNQVYEMCLFLLFNLQINTGKKSHEFANKA